MKNPFKSKKGLGRGLSSLIGDGEVKTNNSKISISSIIPNKYQPRKNFQKEELEELTKSIKERGVIQPLIVRRSDDEGDKYELVAGERRWQASQNAGLHEVPVVIIDADEKTSAVLSIVENVQREDLNSMEEAESLLRLVNEFGMTHDDVSKYISKSRTHVSNLIRLNDLSDYGKEQLRIGTITMGHARAVLTLSLDEQSLILKEAVRKNLSVRAVENLAKQDTRTKFKNKDPDTAILERQLSESLGAKINIKHGKSGGVISIKYSTMNELQGIIEKIRNTNKK